MSIGDKVFIDDVHSDLYTMTAEVITIEGSMATVMVVMPVCRMMDPGMDCIVDRLNIHRLYPIESKVSNVG